jgi:hypothetical protein
MVSSKATTVAAYLKELPPDRRDAIAKVRAVIRENLPDGYQEVVQYGMISYVVPLSRFPDTYNGQPLAVASLASQKGNMALYLMSVYGDLGTRRWFEIAWKKSGKRLDMGKSCVRFKRLDDVPLDVVGGVIARIPVDTFVAQYERSRPAPKKTATKKTATKKTATKKTATKKTATKKTASKSRG